MNWFDIQEKAEAKFLNQLTFRQVYQKVGEIAGKIHKYVCDETRVGLRSINSEKMVVVFFALQTLKKEVFLINIHLSQAEVSEQLADLGITIVFSDDESFIPLDKVWCGEEDKSITPDFIFDNEQVAVIMNTSATGGRYKSVPIKWRHLYHHARASKECLGCARTDNWLLVLPIFHIGGLSIIIRSLFNGTRITILERFDENAVISMIQNGDITMLSVVPTMLSRIISRIERHFLRVVLLGGEYIPNVLVETCIKKAIPLYKTYGMTEHTSQCTTVSVLDCPHKRESAGKALDGVCLRITNQDGEGVGKISVKSPMLMDGYIGHEPLNGWFSTGDIGYLDEDGFLYVLNRRTDIIISGGENIYPREIEDILYRMEGIKECAIIPQDDMKWGQIPVLFVVGSLSEEEILRVLSQNAAKYKVPKKVIFLERLPKTDTGKIARAELRKYACKYKK